MDGTARIPSAPELSSIATALDELSRRVTRIADRNAGTDDDALAQDLYDVERLLREALRRLQRASEPGP